MIHHVGLRVKDVPAAARFYAAALAPLGHVPFGSDGFGPPGAPELWLIAHDEGPRGVHLAFAAPSRAAVDAFHAAALAAGGRDNGKPGLRLEYDANYYAAFAVDPDGYRIEAYCGAAA